MQFYDNKFTENQNTTTGYFPQIKGKSSFSLKKLLETDKLNDTSAINITSKYSINSKSQIGAHYIRSISNELMKTRQMQRLDDNCYKSSHINLKSSDINVRSNFMADFRSTIGGLRSFNSNSRTLNAKNWFGSEYKRFNTQVINKKRLETTKLLRVNTENTITIDTNSFASYELDIYSYRDSKIYIGILKSHKK